MLDDNKMPCETGGERGTDEAIREHQEHSSIAHAVARRQLNSSFKKIPPLRAHYPTVKATIWPHPVTLFRIKNAVESNRVQEWQGI